MSPQAPPGSPLALHRPLAALVDTGGEAGCAHRPSGIARSPTFPSFGKPNAAAAPLPALPPELIEPLPRRSRESAQRAIQRSLP